MGKLRIEYVFRRPRYPLLCVLGDVLIAARTREQLQRQLEWRTVPPGQTFPVIDASGEGWGLHTDLMAISPMVMKKRWTKAELTKLYRSNVAVTQAEANERDYGAWLKWRLEEVVSTIVARVEQGQTPNPRLQRPAVAGESDASRSSEARRQPGDR